LTLFVSFYNGVLSVRKFISNQINLLRFKINRTKTNREKEQVVLRFFLCSNNITKYVCTYTSQEINCTVLAERERKKKKQRERVLLLTNRKKKKKKRRKILSFLSVVFFSLSSCYLLSILFNQLVVFLVVVAWIIIMMIAISNPSIRYVISPS